MDIVLTIDEPTAERAAEAARAMNKSLDQVLRETVEQLAGGGSADRDCAEMARLTAETTGRIGDWTFDRDELHARR
ncbi:hypothetical protein ABIE65_004522 [Constrictibacter sp. MBR-5]|uniref:hypothetical protein n=1 Tax=Constrictibacter sp. MBR-5 TaxID=3156467 RepID=UPI003396E49F